MIVFLLLQGAGPQPIDPFAKTLWWRIARHFGYSETGFIQKQLNTLGPNFRVRTLPKSTYVHIEYGGRHDEEDPENKHVMTSKLLQSFEETRDQAPYYMSPIISLSVISKDSSCFLGLFSP